MRAYQYSRWDGTQTVDPASARELMDHLADKILDGRDLRSIMRDLMQRGARMPSGRQMPGLRDLLDKLRERRQQQLQRYNMDSVMDDIKEKLEQIIKTERQGIERRLDEARGKQDAESGQDGTSKPHAGQQGGQNRQQSGQLGDQTGQPGGEAGQQGPAADDTEQRLRDMLERMAQRHLEQLDQLPPQASGRIQQLRDYDFMDQEAREQFEELLQSLQKQVAEQMFQGLKQGLGAMTPEQMQAMQQMVKDLNQPMRDHQRGDDSGFQDFMDKWGDFFPEGIENPDQLAEHLQQQMAQMQSLLNSMSPEMRQELNDLMAELFQNGEFQDDLAELMYNLDQVYPVDHGQQFPFQGDDPVTLQEALRTMGDMNGLDELEQELLEAVRTGDATNLNSDEIAKLVGEEARRIAEELQEFARMLEDAGLIRRHGSQWELTPRALRRIGERALEQIFGRVDRGLAGDHNLTRHGWGVERLEETKQYQFGDAFAIDVNGTVRNALRRDGGGTPVRLAIDDFEVYRSASVDQCATVIMLDMSYSMLRGGRFLAGRNVAMALDSLIKTKFPRDVLELAAFSYFVLPLKSDMILDTSWIDPGGTDFPVAIRAARAMLSKHKEGTKQIVLITDGEPHANAYGYDWGRYDGGWSMREAMEETLREVKACTKSGIVVNTFMLDTEPVMTTFIKALAKLNKGRIFFADPTQLGDYLIVDYMKNRHSRA